MAFTGTRAVRRIPDNWLIFPALNPVIQMP
jgi:hypothetical protein